MEYAETGKIKVIRETQTFASGFSKREFVLTTVGEYPQDLKMEVVKDKCTLLDKFKVGQTVKASFNLRGSYHAPSDAYFVSLQAWKIEAGANVAAPVATPVADPIGDDEPLPF
jgi:hypothetical protein